MSNIDETFALMSASSIVSEDPTVDYVIDSYLRVVTIPEHGVVLGVEGDKDINYVSFIMPRLYKGIDMSEFQIRINYANANGERNFYKVKETFISDDQIRFTWIVPSDAVAYVGDVTFAVRFLKLSGSRIMQEFNTTLASARSLVGLDVDNEISQVQREDLLEHFYREVEDYSQTKKNEISALTNTSLKSIEDKGAETLATIPTQYTDICNDVETLKKSIGGFRFEVDPDDNGLNIIYSY